MKHLSCIGLLFVTLGFVTTAMFGGDEAGAGQQPTPPLQSQQIQILKLILRKTYRPARASFQRFELQPSENSQEYWCEHCGFTDTSPYYEDDGYCKSPACC